MKVVKLNQGVYAVKFSPGLVGEIEEELNEYDINEREFLRMIVREIWLHLDRENTVLDAPFFDVRPSAEETTPKKFNSPITIIISE